MRWFGHIERMEDARLTKKIHCANVEGERRRGRPNKRWKDGVNELLYRKADASGLAREDVKMSVHDRTKWRDFYRAKT